MKMIALTNYKTKKIIFIIIMCLFMLSFLIVGSTEAWFYIGGSNDDITITLGDFDAQAYLSVNDVNLYNQPTIFDQNKHLFSLNGVTKTKYTPEEQVGEFFIEDLNVDILVNTDIAAYVRVKVITEWKLTRTYTRIQRDPVTEAVYVTNPFQYHLVTNNEDESDWYYDQPTGYVYYKVIINKGYQTIPFIDGANGYNTASSRNFIEDCVATIGLEVDIVQANRYQALWGIESLPWEA